MARLCAHVTKLDHSGFHPIALVVSYLRLVVDLRFAVVDAGLTQLIYLMFFSYVFFFEGFTGLAVTIGAILMLFVVMQIPGGFGGKRR